MNRIKIAPEPAVKLQCYDAFLQYVCAGNNPLIAHRVIAGGCAGVIAELISHPLDVVRTRIAGGRKGEYTSIAHCAREVWKSGGVGACYAGIVPSLVGIAPFASIDLTTNQLLRDVAKDKFPLGAPIPPAVLFACGCASSSFAMMCTFPLYVLKTRLAFTNESLRTCVSTIMRSGGVRGFYSGALPALCKVAPASGVSYATYQWLNARL